MLAALPSCQELRWKLAPLVLVRLSLQPVININPETKTAIAGVRRPAFCWIPILDFLCSLIFPGGQVRAVADF